MGARYPDQVGVHKPCVPVVGFCVLLSPFGTVFVCHDGGHFATTVAVGAFGRHGPPRTEPKGGVGRSGRESGMAVGRFCRNAFVHPNGSARPRFRGVGTVC